MRFDDRQRMKSNRCPECGRPADARDPLGCRCAETRPGEPLAERTPLRRPSEEGRAGAPSDATGDAAGTEAPFTAIARFRNIAEAGFFAEELARRNVPASVRVDDQFDALRGNWNTSFLLLVPSERAEASAILLQELIRRSEGGELDDALPALGTLDEYGLHEREWDDRGGNHYRDEARAGIGTAFEFESEDRGAGIGWVPLILTLTAGSVIVWGLRHAELWGAGPGAAPLSEREWIELRKELGTSERPWTQPTRDGQGVRKLWFDRDRNRVAIQVERHRNPRPTTAAFVAAGGIASAVAAEQ